MKSKYRFYINSPSNLKPILLKAVRKAIHGSNHAYHVEIRISNNFIHNGDFFVVPYDKYIRMQDQILKDNDPSTWLPF